MNSKKFSAKDKTTKPQNRTETPIVPSRFTPQAGFVPNTISVRQAMEMEMGIYRDYSAFPVIRKTGAPQKCSDGDVETAKEIFSAAGEYKEVSARMKAERGIDKTPDAWRKLVDRRR